MTAEGTAMKIEAEVKERLDNEPGPTFRPHEAGRTKCRKEALPIVRKGL
jgi:hypothetical protein